MYMNYFMLLGSGHGLWDISIICLGVHKLHTSGIFGFQMYAWLTDYIEKNYVFQFINLWQMVLLAFVLDLW